MPLTAFPQVRGTFCGECVNGPRGGVRIGYDNVDRYFNNTSFTDLVRDGWVGSRGVAVATAQIATLVRRSLDTGHAVLIGVEPAQSSGLR